MDDRRFDDILRAVGTLGSRRDALKALAAGLLGAGTLAAVDAEAKKGGHGKDAKKRSHGKDAKKGKGKENKKGKGGQKDKVGTRATVSGNPTCEGRFTGGTTLKVDPPAPGQQDVNTTDQNGNACTCTLCYSFNGSTVSFGPSQCTSAPNYSPCRVQTLIVKGGPNATVISFGSGGATSGSGTTPINPNNNRPYGLSHFDFCGITCCTPKTCADFTGVCGPQNDTCGGLTPPCACGTNGCCNSSNPRTTAGTCVTPDTSTSSCPCCSAATDGNCVSPSSSNANCVCCSAATGGTCTAGCTGGQCCTAGSNGYCTATGTSACTCCSPTTATCKPGTSNTECGSTGTCTDCTTQQNRICYQNACCSRVCPAGACGQQTICGESVDCGPCVCQHSNPTNPTFGCMNQCTASGTGCNGSTCGPICAGYCPVGQGGSNPCTNCATACSGTYRCTGTGTNQQVVSQPCPPPA